MIASWVPNSSEERCQTALKVTAGGPKDRRRALEVALPRHLWGGEVDAAVELLREALGWVRNPKALEDLIGDLEKRSASIPDSGERQRVGLWIARRVWRSSTTGRCRGVASTRG